MVKDKVVIVTGAGRRHRPLTSRWRSRQTEPRSSSTTWVDPATNRPSQKVAAEISGGGAVKAVANTDSVADPAAAAATSCRKRPSIPSAASIAWFNNAGIVPRPEVLQYVHRRMEGRRRCALERLVLCGACRGAAFLKPKSPGVSVNMTSTSGLIGNLGQANYSAAKMGIAGLSKSIALGTWPSSTFAPTVSLRGHGPPMTATIPPDTPENIARIEKDEENGSPPR